MGSVVRHRTDCIGESAHPRLDTPHISKSSALAACATPAAMRMKA
jgi:hypothetical protein